MSIDHRAVDRSGVVAIWVESLHLGAGCACVAREHCPQFLPYLLAVPRRPYYKLTQEPSTCSATRTLASCARATCSLRCVRGRPAASGTDPGRAPCSSPIGRQGTIGLVPSQNAGTLLGTFNARTILSVQLTGMCWCTCVPGTAPWAVTAAGGATKHPPLILGGIPTFVSLRLAAPQIARRRKAHQDKNPDAKVGLQTHGLPSSMLSFGFSTRTMVTPFPPTFAPVPPGPRSSPWALVTPLSPCPSTLRTPWPRPLPAWPPARATAGGCKGEGTQY